MKTLLNAQDQAEIVKRLQTLHPTSARRWGKMSVNQMICHLSDSFRGPMGDKPLAAAYWPARGMMKWLALWVPVPWPRNVKTRPEMDPQLGGTKPVSLESDLQELLGLLDRFTGQPRGFEFRNHPLFGSMSDKEWMRWGYLHMDHHLRQFGV
jgi:uncharacterized protein DUF1569